VNQRGIFSIMVYYIPKSWHARFLRLVCQVSFTPAVLRLAEIPRAQQPQIGSSALLVSSRGAARVKFAPISVVIANLIVYKRLTGEISEQDHATQVTPNSRNERSFF
jgi:hypothetical protein